MNLLGIETTEMLLLTNFNYSTNTCIYCSVYCPILSHRSKDGTNYVCIFDDIYLFSM